ncbi:uncharacterized protein LOC121786796 [Salvia splendens]|uniref:uncharacterized protein LOC121786796 n=1 Tax=Salvia splendens TaxID=180675 RepID=UPI001C252D6B|nr:uncharacterized protein LOC121786796 [Salvia splendens]
MWEDLEKKYRSNDAGTKKFIIVKYLDYKMVDSRPVIDQVQEFQIIIHELATEGMILPENFTSGTIIEKLPPSWKDFKSYLKHKRKEMTLEELIVKLCNEFDVRKNDQKARGHGSFEAKANLLERGGPSNKRHRPNRPTSKDKSKNKKSAAYVVEKEFKDWDENDLIAVVTEEANLIENKGSWYIDTGATAHVCADRNKFSTYNPIDGRKINMGIKHRPK